MVEIWKDLENYIGIYQISNTGKVKSLARPVYIKDKIINLKERLLKNVNFVKQRYSLVFIEI